MNTERPKQLFVRSREAHRLAKELAGRTGDTITGAVPKAIRAELAIIDATRARAEATTARELPK